jgi:hypothetical protein
MLRLLDCCVPAYAKAGQGERFRMFRPRIRRVGARVWDALPGLLLVPLSLLTVVWLSPDVPYPLQDSAWVLALNQAVADRLAFGRDVGFQLGPWGNVYAGQYHPATDGMMLFGGAVVALALASGLCALARGGRRWLILLAPLLIATIGLRDPVFVALPLLLLAVAVVRPEGRGGRWTAFALLLLTASCALLTLVKGTFGTQAVPMVGLAVLALLRRRRFRLTALMLASYAGSLVGFWLLAGQRLIDFPAYVASRPVVIAGYSEGLAVDGPLSDIAAYLCGSAAVVWLFWRGRTPGEPYGSLLLANGLLFTLFVAFKSGFVRHDEHALIAAGTLAMVPVLLVAALRPWPLAAAVLISLSALTFVSQHYPGYEWPSFARGRDRLTMAASGTWTRITDPGRLSRWFDAQMNAVRTTMPLPQVSGPTDIYSSGQTILLANGIEWSPRPALQSVTVLSDTLEKADLDHLTGADGRHPPVQNVFYRVESEDNRLRTTEDGLSWPALLTEFRVQGYDRALDTAVLRRQPNAGPPPTPGLVLLDGRHRLGEEVGLPEFASGLAWATLDIEPTFAGRLASLLFRPPLLTITIRYANGTVEQARLVSALARAGFLLTPRVLSTADMLMLLLPERRTPAERPLSITATGESGTRWLWQPAFALRLQDIAIPVQEQVRAMLQPAVLNPSSVAADDLGAAEVCNIELVNGHRASATPIEVQGIAEVSGWSVISVAPGAAPDHVLVRLTDRGGHAWETVAEPRPRIDVAGFFVDPALTATGFDARFDVSSLAGAYTATIVAERGGSSWQCKLTQDLIVIGPGRTTP